MLTKTLRIITILLFVGAIVCLFFIGLTHAVREVDEPVAAREVRVPIHEPGVPVREIEPDLGENTGFPIDIYEEKPPIELDPMGSVETSEMNDVDPYEAELLAMVIYQEAGGDACCDECRRRVADVVLNRVEDPRFPNTILEVLTQERQYGRFHWTGVIWPERAGTDSEAAAVARARRIAQEVLSGKHSDLYGNGYIWQAEFIQGTGVVYCDCGIYFGR